MLYQPNLILLMVLRETITKPSLLSSRNRFGLKPGKMDKNVISTLTFLAFRNSDENQNISSSNPKHKNLEIVRNQEPSGMSKFSINKEMAPKKIRSIKAEFYDQST